MSILPASLAPTTAFEALAPRRKVLLYGDGASTVSSYVIARRACERLPVRLICSDNLFNPYRISRFAKDRGIRPADALSLILIARAFTAYQLVELIDRLDACSDEFIVITGICSAFFDEDLSHTDAARLFYRVYWKLHSLTRRGGALLLVEANTLPTARRRYFLNDLMQTTEVVLSLTGNATCTIEERPTTAPHYSFNRILRG